jgi:5-methylcytosine-specific restriction endonuclease McrA
MNKFDEEQKIREQVRQRDNFCCYFCERDIRRGKIKSLSYSIHHIVPKRFGGKFEKKNLITLCKFCHNKFEKLFQKALNPIKQQLTTEEGTE